jgi:hypothetical protein
MGLSSNPGWCNGSQTVTGTLSTPSVTSDITNVTYSYNIRYGQTWSTSGDYCQGSISTPNGTLSGLSFHAYDALATYPNSFNGGWNANALSFTISDGGGSRLLGMNIQSGSAYVTHSTPIPNSTTPSNTYILSSYTYDLTSAQVLATGTLNWLAIGV